MWCCTGTLSAPSDVADGEEQNLKRGVVQRLCSAQVAANHVGHVPHLGRHRMHLILLSSHALKQNHLRQVLYEVLQSVSLCAVGASLSTCTVSAQQQRLCSRRDDEYLLIQCATPLMVVKRLTATRRAASAACFTSRSSPNCAQGMRIAQSWSALTG